MWTFSKIWNESIEQREERAIAARSRIWASELGKSDVDIFLKLNGVPPSNEFDARSIRKFEAGNLFEWVVKIVLQRAGIYKESQKWISNNEFGLEVTGRLDHVAGGVIDGRRAIEELSQLALPEFFMRTSSAIIEFLTEKYNGELSTQGIEVKSTSSYGIEKVYETNNSLAGHDLQTFHYAFNEKMPFLLLYICRDDLRMAEISINEDDAGLLEKYKNKIARIAEYHKRNEQPPLEPEIIFENGRFSKNFNVEYSAFLTLLYGYPSPNDYSEKVSRTIESWNRVLTRIKNGDKITDNNKEKIDAMKCCGFDVEKIIGEKI